MVLWENRGEEGRSSVTHFCVTEPLVGIGDVVVSCYVSVCGKTFL